MTKIIQFSEIPVHGVIQLHYDGDKLTHQDVDFPIVRATYLFDDNEIETYYYNSWNHYDNYRVCSLHDINKFEREKIDNINEVPCLYDDFDEELLNVLKEDYKDDKVPFNVFLEETINRSKHHGVYISKSVEEYLEELNKWAKPIRCVETGEEFLTVRDCSKHLNIPYMTVYNCVKNGNAHKKTGLHFEEIKEKG